MRKYSDLTKEMLESYGITNITEDAQVFMGDKELHQTIASKKGKYKDQVRYARLVISDKSEKIYSDKHGNGWWTYKTIVIPVHRAVYAWYHGIAPAGLDVDHIDNNTLNNNLSNLQLLTREENNRKKVVSRNQYNCHMTDEEILAHRATKKYVYDRDTHTLVKADWWEEELKQKKAAKEAAKNTKKRKLYDEWHRLVAQCEELQRQRLQARADGDLAKWRELGEKLAETKHKAATIKRQAKNIG